MRVLLVHPGASFSTADVYTGYRDALRRQGHEVIEYLLDQRLEVARKHLRALWRHARHPGTPTLAHITFEAGERIITQALWHKVDFVLHVSVMYLHPDHLVLMRRAHIPNVAILTESPYDDAAHERLLPYIDLAFTNERTSVARLRRVNPDVHYLPHAHDPQTHHPDSYIGPHAPAHDVVFVGTGFKERIALLAGVDWAGLDLGLYGSWHLLGSRHPLRRFVAGGVTPNATTAALYRRAKVGLNLYRTADEAHSLNPRAVELAACGCFYVSEYRAEVFEVFGRAVPTFIDASGLEDNIRFYLNRPDLRARFARELPARVEHLTFDRQADYLVSTLRAAWQGASAIRSA